MNFLKTREFIYINIIAITSFIIAGPILKLSLYTHRYLPILPLEPILLSLMLGPLKKRAVLTLFAGEIAYSAGEVVAGNHVTPEIILRLCITLGVYLPYIILKNFIDGANIIQSKFLIKFLFITTASALLVSIIEAIYFKIVLHALFYIPLIAGFSASSLSFMIITPLLLLIIERARTHPKGFQVDRRAITFIAGHVLLLSLVFGQGRLNLSYAVPLGLMLLAYALELAAVAVAMLLTAAVAVGCSMMNYGPMGLFNGPMPERIFALQLFLAILAASTLTMAALITEHRLLKQSLIASRRDAEAANQSKSVFLATISHEIRTPLNGLLGMTQVLAMKGLTAAQSECVDVISRSGEALLSLLNDILDLSKIEAGRLDLESIDFDLGEVIRGAMQTYRSVAESKGLSLIGDANSAEGRFIGDPNRIRQILYNLVSNALKFTPSGEVRVTCRFEANMLTLSVADTGMGIPADKIDRLFAKFSQADESTTRRFGGTGLGLSICRELATLMGGTIDAQSQDGLGSTFTLTLPLERVGDSRGLSDASSAGQAPLADRGLRVLAAEDNPTNQLVLKTLLEQVGIEIVLVSDGMQAVEAWEREPWEVILMDVQMPVLDGPSATRAIRLRERDLARRRTPIVALTANAMAHQIALYTDAGMDAHVAKPINAARLFQVIGDICEEAPSGAELHAAAG